MRDLIPRLKAAGAQGIVEYPLNKIVHVSGPLTDAEDHLRIDRQRAVGRAAGRRSGRRRPRSSSGASRRIVADVRARRRSRRSWRYARRFDSCRLEPAGAVEVPRAEIEAGAAAVSPAGARGDRRRAARDIRTVAAAQVPKGWRDHGVRRASPWSSA